MFLVQAGKSTLLQNEFVRVHITRSVFEMAEYYTTLSLLTMFMWHDFTNYISKLRYLIEFNKDAWSLEMVVEMVFISARKPTPYVHFADFT